MDKKDIKEIEEILGYEFKDKSILQLALTHSSYANENKELNTGNYERLEFLGDALLEAVVSEYLFTKYPLEQEGVLSKRRSRMVCETTLAIVARDMGMGKFLLLGKGEENSGGHDRSSILSDCIESIIAAIYMDGGYLEVKKFIYKIYLTIIEEKTLFYDSKTRLQEILQEYSTDPIIYEVVEERGPDHNKFFAIQVSHRGEVLGKGEGRNKKNAEQDAAANAIEKIYNE